MFKPIRYDSGKLDSLAAKGSITFVKGNALADDGTGYLTNATSSTATDIKYIAWENRTTGATDGEMLQVYRVMGGVQLEADCDAAPAQTDVHTYADLAAAGTVNPDASSNDLFYIEKAVLPLTSAKVIGYFVDGVPNS